MNVNLDGTTTATSFLPASAIPEPGTGSLALAGILIAFAAPRIGRRVRR